MGDDLAQYRARIGTFKSYRVCSTRPSQCSRHTTILDISDVILCIFGVIEFVRILLVINGVEQNPGPEGREKAFLCDTCKTINVFESTCQPFIGNQEASVVHPNFANQQYMPGMCKDNLNDAAFWQFAQELPQVFQEPQSAFDMCVMKTKLSGSEHAECPAYRTQATMTDLISSTLPVNKKVKNQDISGSSEFTRRKDNVCKSICPGSQIKQTFEMFPKEGTCCFLIGNKGMHSYNGNPLAGRMTLDEKTEMKLRLCVLLVEGGGLALRHTISRKYLKDKLQSVDSRTIGKLDTSDNKQLYPAGCSLPSLYELTQSGRDMVWTEALKQDPLQDITTDHICDYLVSSVVKNNKNKWDELKKLKVLKKDQYDLLSSVQVPEDVQKLDITLLCCVLTNVYLCKPSSKDWSLYPPDTHQDIGDDVQRLRLHRNDLAHDSTYRIDNEQFTRDWKNIENVLLRLLGNWFSSNIKELREGAIDQNLAEKCRQIIEEWKDFERSLSEKVQEFRSENKQAHDQTKAAVKKLSVTMETIQRDVAGIKDDVNILKSSDHDETMEAIKELSTSFGQSSEDNRPKLQEFRYENRQAHHQIQGALETIQRDVAGIKDDVNILKSSGQSSEDNRPKMMQEIVSVWEREEEKVYKTKGITATKDEILSKNCVCVVGVPGSGKTTAIRYAALSLKTKGFVIYNIHKSKDILEYFQKDKKQIFILDNILGVYSIDQDEINYWINYKDDIEKILDDNTKLLVSMRTQLFKQARMGYEFVFLQEPTCIDATYRLEEDDMKGMLRQYLERQQISNIEGLIRQIWHHPESCKEMTGEEKVSTGEKKESKKPTDTQAIFLQCFPLLCEVFCTEEFARDDPRTFFQYPFAALQNIFKTMDKRHFCGLVLSAAFDGELTEDMFSDFGDNDEKDIRLRDVIMSSFGLKKQGELTRIKTALESLDGVYVSKLGNAYQMHHSVFHDVVVYCFNNTDPSFVFKYAKSEFIRDRVRLTETQPSDPYMILIKHSKNIERLAKRLIDDLNPNTRSAAMFIDKNPGIDFIKRGARFLSDNPNITDDRLISVLERELSNLEQRDKTLIGMLFEQCMLSVFDMVRNKTFKDGDIPQSKLIKLCVQKGVDCNMDIVADRYPLHLCIEAGDLELTKLLLENGADKRIRNLGTEESILQFTCMYAKSNKLELIKLLTEHVGDKSVVAITRDKDEILKKLEIASNDLQLQEVLTNGDIVVLTEEKTEIKHELEKYTGDGRLQLVEHDDFLIHTDVFGRNILHYAADNINILEYILILASKRQVFKLLSQSDYKKRTLFVYVDDGIKAISYGETEEVTMSQDDKTVFRELAVIY